MAIKKQAREAPILWLIKDNKERKEMMSSETNGLIKNYVVLKVKEASLWSVFRLILPSGSKEIRNLIDCPKHKEKKYTNYRARWRIFMFILLLKFILLLATPLGMLGTVCLKLVRGRRTMATTQSAPPQPQPRPSRRRSHASSSDMKAFPTDELPFTFASNITGHSIPEPECEECEVNLNAIAKEMRSKVRCKDWEIIDLNETIDLHDRDFRYYGALTILASKLAYSHKPSHVHAVVNDYWKMNLIGCYNFWNDFQKEHSTHAFMFENTARDPNVTVVAFRGTDAFDVNDWMVDFNFSWYKIKGVGNLHSGFLQALGLQNTDPSSLPKEISRSAHKFAYYTICQKLRDIAKANPNAKFIITGHSLGGALATLFVTLLAIHDESTVLDKLEAVYTFGQPRVGDRKFKKYMEETVMKRYQFKYYSFVYAFDLVPRVPFDSLLFKYKHFGKCVYYDCFYNGQILDKPPSTNYFSVKWLIPKYLSAWWDLIRSLIYIPLFKGRVHFEGFDAIMLRCLGLIIPGLPAHTCPNYVNLTRMGTMTPLHKYTVKRILEDIVCFLGLFVLFVCGWQYLSPLMF